MSPGSAIQIGLLLTLLPVFFHSLGGGVSGARIPGAAARRRATVLKGGNGPVQSSLFFS